MTYVRLASWHLVNGPWTRCGRLIPADRQRADALPLNERSCEACLRLAAHDGERTDVPNDPVAE